MIDLHTVLPALLTADTAAPRLTYYDDATGERVEFSAKVLANWTAKAANFLVEEAEAGLSTTVGLVLPTHWRAMYWALASWSVGATVVVGSDAPEAEVVVTDDADIAAAAVRSGRYAVLVTLAALARSRPDTPAGATDEARELASYGDVFAPIDRPAASSAALRWEDGEAAYRTTTAALVTSTPLAPGTRVRVPDDLSAALRTAIAAWHGGGSIVIVRNALSDQAHRLAAERVTLDLG
ncbi:MAG TPA: TIGR03089 family protein [Dermatophilaceae bacterium]|nr:TIGR03089 family protein [Dermatophilaceae bacterium]